MKLLLKKLGTEFKLQSVVKKSLENTCIFSQSNANISDPQSKLLC